MAASCVFLAFGLEIYEYTPAVHTRVYEYTFGCVGICHLPDDGA